MLQFFRKYFSKPKVLAPLESSEDATLAFAELFSGHGLPVALVDGWIISQNGRLSAQARVFYKEPKDDGTIILQLDLEVRSKGNRTILESVSGVGISRRNALLDAIVAFTQGSFHVLYSALSGHACSHCEIEEWDFCGKKRKVYLGPISRRSSKESMPSEDIDWFPEIESRIRSLELDPSLHSLRLYHSDGMEKLRISEALLDGEHNADLVKVLDDFAWPRFDGFYSNRMFLIIGSV